MPRIKISHTTEYTYHRPVRLAAHRLMLRPRDSHDLRLDDARLSIVPPPRNMRWAHDVVGNSVCFIDWDGTVETDRLRIVSTLDLRHYPSIADLPLDPAAEFYPFAYDVEEAPDLARLQERHYPDPARVVENWARSFLHPHGSTRTLDLLTAMTRAIKADFFYAAREEEGTRAPAVTLRTRTGACRDLALLMMEAVRSLGLAARFISGYLYDENRPGTSGGSVVGGGATHAWVAVYLPGAGWIEFDPTNGLIAGRNLIRVTAARTPGGAVPVSGTFTGGPNDFKALHVAVETVVGDPESPGPMGALSLESA